MDELISKQAAIDLWEKYHYTIAVDAIRYDAELRQLPSAQPEPKRGKWIHVSEEMWKCDQCGEISCCSPNFCPDCGSYNGDENEI